MLALLQFLKSILSQSAHATRRLEGDEAFLAEAVDVCDLERRIHAIDDRGRTSAGIVFGLYPR